MEELPRELREAWKPPREKIDGFISVKKALEDAFFLGMRLGIGLAGFTDGIGSKLMGKAPKEIEEIVRKEIDTVFKKFEDLVPKKTRKRGTE